MKKITVLLFVMAAALCGMQVSAQPAKAPARSNVYNYLPSGYIALGTYDNPNHIYYSTQRQTAVPQGNVYGISIIGEVDGKYYSTTYAKANSDNSSDAGAGFIAAMKVGSYDAVICDCQSGTTSNSVKFSARVEPAGEYAAKVIYTLTNNAWFLDRTISLGVWADIMIGDNDYAPIYRLVNDQGKVYGLDMKYKSEEEAVEGEKIPVFTAIFGGGLTGVTPVNDYWFGQFRNNYNASEIIGNYDNLCDIQTGTGDNATFQYDVVDEFYMTEGGSYDSGMGFCWKNITLAAGESVELSFVVSASEIDIEDPEPPVPDPEEEYNLEVLDTPEWNDLTADHPAHVWGYYKNAFGFTGYMEYLADGNRGAGEWTRIPGELVSDAEFDLSFDFNLDPNVADIHTLKLRINDGEGNYRYLDELDQEWEDVRTIDMTVNPEIQYYDGTPKTFVVTIGGLIDYTLGENGEYVDPGTYDFSIYGDYDMNTIGINTVEFSVVRRQAVVEVVVPEDCVYDGEEHAATVTCDGDGDVIVTYVNANTNEVSNEAPTEPGTYAVFVEVTDGEIYDGIENKSYGEFTITKKQAVVDVVVPEDCEYDGEEYAATVTYDGDGDVIVTYVDTETNESSTDAPTEPGTYEVFVEVTGGEYYDGIENTSYGEFTIDRRQCEYTLILPEALIKFDGKTHGASVTVPEGSGVPTIKYLDLTNRASEPTTTPPSAVGRYAIILDIDDSGKYYYGMDEPTIVWQFEIYTEQTGVNELMIDNDNNGAWYTIDGRRVAAPTHSGIYIHNGHKVIVK